MTEAYSTFKGRSKAGRGKLFYGIPAKRLEALKTIRCDTGIQMSAHLDSLFQFTDLFITYARDLAKAGKKDEARNWCRFFECSSVLNLLARTDRDVSRLSSALQSLRVECHPLDVPSFTTDLQAIRHCLNLILTHVQQKSLSACDVRSSGDGGPVHRCDGEYQLKFEGDSLSAFPRARGRGSISGMSPGKTKPKQKVWQMNKQSR